MYISITNLQLKSIWKLWTFIKYNRQIKTSKEVLSVDTKGISLTEFYTLTSWDSKEDMLAFMRNGAHAVAMKVSAQFSKKITVHGYEVDQVPAWDQAIYKLNNKE